MLITVISFSVYKQSSVFESVDNKYLHSNPDEVLVSEQNVVEFVMGRFSDIRESKRIADLVEFQAMNKYMLMVHNQGELKILGNLVASYKKIPFDKILHEYDEHLKIALSTEPTTKTHINVLMHIYGYFSRHFDSSEKELFQELVSQFRDKKITVGKILSEINPLVYRFNQTYLARQTYFLLYADPRPGILFAAFDNLV